MARVVILLATPRRDLTLVRGTRLCGRPSRRRSPLLRVGCARPFRSTGPYGRSMLSRPSHRHVCSLTLVPRPHCVVLPGGRLRNVSSGPALAHAPPPGGLTTGRLTGRDKGDRSCDPARTGGPGYGVSFHHLRTCPLLGLGQQRANKRHTTHIPAHRPPEFLCEVIHTLIFNRELEVRDPRNFILGYARDGGAR